MSYLPRSSIVSNSTSPSITKSINWTETETLATFVFGIIAIFASAATVWQGHRMWKSRHQRDPPINTKETLPSDATSVSVDIEAGLRPARTVLPSSPPATENPAPAQAQVFQQSPLEHSKTEEHNEPDTRFPLTSNVHWTSSIPPTTARSSDVIVSSASEEEHKVHGRFTGAPPA
ncbi:hypothetical protein MMC22_009932 [Lobaria immixta]|nr:hypothetical protein [Lobaria immixta]